MLSFADVLFRLPSAVQASAVAVGGDFNGWSQTEHLLSQRGDGSWLASIDVPQGRYRFRYLLDGERWENDWAADSYEPNEFGGYDSVIEVGGWAGKGSVRPRVQTHGSSARERR